MNKLLIAYLNNPTLKNAQKVVAYNLKHPMSHVMFTQFDGELFQDAADHAAGYPKRFPSERRVN